MAKSNFQETSPDVVESFRNIRFENSSNDWRDTKTASQCVEYLCLSPHLSDITLKFSKEPSVTLPAHKCILGMRSRVFEAMFYEKQGMTDNSTTIDDIESKTMQELIRYIYTDKAEIKVENVLQCLRAAERFAVAGFAAKCSSFLEDNIGAENVCMIHGQAIQYSMKEIQTKCYNYMLQNASDVFKSSGFLKISKSALVNLLKSDDLAADEETIFTAASAWAEAQCILGKMSASRDNKRTVLGEALYQIRFPLMTIQNFAKHVTPAKILTSDEEIMLYQYLASKGTTQLSKFVTRERNGNFVTIDVSHLRHQDDLQRDQECVLTIKRRGIFSNPIMLKAIICNFAEKVKRVRISSKYVEFMVKERQLIFNPVIPIYGLENIVFETHNKGDVYSNSVKFHSKVHNTDISIKSVPDGLTNILFDINRLILYVDPAIDNISTL